MGKILGVSFCLFFLSLVGCGQSQNNQKNLSPKFEEEEAVDPSTQGPFEQCQGAPWQGHLVSATDIGFAGPGFVKIFRERHASYGTFDLIAVLKKGVQKLQQEFPNTEPLQLGDLSARFGGHIGAHESHQCGVDGDIRFLSKDHRIQPDTNTGFGEQFVIDGKLSPNFDLPRNWALISGFLATGRVNRIFVAGPIKKGLCAYATSIHQKTLFKNAFGHIQILENHTDHMHLRITCPLNSPQCEKQDDAGPDTDCS
jgi:penicillin-insensitive murein endopeptidase